jgi:hypothetical protein
VPFGRPKYEVLALIARARALGGLQRTREALADARRAIALRCNGCGEVFTASEPESAGPEKFDASSMAMTALVKYGAGMPFHRLEQLPRAASSATPPPLKGDDMLEVTDEIPGTAEFIKWFGYWPSFHDTEVLDLKLCRSGPSTIR